MVTGGGRRRDGNRDARHYPSLAFREKKRVPPVTGGPAVDSTRRRTALHEAAHAVVGHALGDRVRLVVAASGHGFVEFYPRTDLSPFEAAVRGCVSFLAGEAGERLAPVSGYVEPVDDDAIAAATDAALAALTDDDRTIARLALAATTDPSARDDAAKAEAAAREVAGEEGPLLVRFAHATATRLVWGRAPAVLALAAELGSRPSLEGAAVESIIEAALAGQKET